MNRVMYLQVLQSSPLCISAVSTCMHASGHAQRENDVSSDALLNLRS